MTNPALADTTDNGRFYRDTLPPCQILTDLNYAHDPELAYPSVTTVIGNGIPKKVLYLDGDNQPVDVLDKWGVREVAEFAVDHLAEWRLLERDAAVKLLKNAPNRTRDGASKRGTDVHEIVDRLARGQVVPTLSDDLEPWIRSARQFVADFRPKVIWSEVTVFNRQFGYAGTLDLIGDFPGYGRMIADYKTSKAVYGSTGVQLAAYRHAEYGILDDSLPAGEMHRRRLPDGIEGGLIVNLTADGYKVIPVECGTRQLDAFVCAIEVANHCAEADRLVGAPLRPVDHSSDDLQLTKAWLYRRVQVLIQRYPAAAQQVAQTWPAGLPTIGKPTHTADELAQIETHLDQVEAAHDVPFGEAKPAPAGAATSRSKRPGKGRKQEQAA